MIIHSGVISGNTEEEASPLKVYRFINLPIQKEKQQKPLHMHIPFLQYYNWWVTLEKKHFVCRLDPNLLALYLKEKSELFNYFLCLFL